MRGYQTTSLQLSNIFLAQTSAPLQPGHNSYLVTSPLIESVPPSSAVTHIWRACHSPFVKCACSCPSGFMHVIFLPRTLLSVPFYLPIAKSRHPSIWDKLKCHPMTLVPSHAVLSQRLVTTTFRVYFSARKWSVQLFPPLNYELLEGRAQTYSTYAAPSTRPATCWALWKHLPVEHLNERNTMGYGVRKSNVVNVWCLSVREVTFLGFSEVSLARGIWGYMLLK